jgi:tryptophan 7-halogenase
VTVRVLGDGSLAAAIRARLPETTDTPLLEIAAFEDAPIDAFFDGAVASVPRLMVICRPRQVLVGPAHRPGLTACPACVLRTVGGSDVLATFRSSVVAPQMMAAAASRVAQVALAALGGEFAFELAGTAILTEEGVERRTVQPRSDCARCGLGTIESVTRADVTIMLAHEESMSPVATPGALDRPPTRSVGIVGGGTAGYLAALGLRQKCPELAITIIESPDIPVIGVGEATTPALTRFLHDTLGIDRLRLHREVRATWKLGIRFDWGPKEREFFCFPFGGSRLLEAHAFDHDHNAQSLGSLLMAAERAPVVRTDNGEDVSILPGVLHAYHLDNKSFVAFLQRVAAERGIRVERATIEAVDGNDDHIDGLVASDGRRFSFDLYVDCTGFRALLIERTLKSPFISYASTLFTDTAIVGNTPHGGTVKPYTQAETMPNGWCWRIPQRDEDHRGYVFASAFSTVEQATADMRAANPGLGDTWTVRFRSGRHAHFWKGNVVALGNAYAFVEPLESTALHMLVDAIGLLGDSLSGEGSTPQLLNDVVARRWDWVRSFLALHYRFNRRLDTEFWTTCRSSVDLAGAESLVEHFWHAAPLHRRADAALLIDTYGHDPIFNLFGVDNILLGQGVETKLLVPPGDRATFRRWRDTVAATIVKHALPQNEALEAYERLLARDPSVGATPPRAR